MNSTFSQAIPKNLPMPKPKQHRRWTAGEKRRAIELAQTGLGANEIHREMPARTEASIQSLLNRNGFEKKAQKAKAKEALVNQQQQDLNEPPTVGTRSM